MPNYKEHLEHLKDFYENIDQNLFENHDLASRIQDKSYLPVQTLLLLLSIGFVFTLLLPQLWLTKLYLISLIALFLVMVWQPFHYFIPKEKKDKLQLYYYIKHYPVYRYRNHFLFIKDFSARPFAYVYTLHLQKVTRLSSKIQYDKLFKKDIQALKNNQDIEINGFLDTAFNELKEKKLPIIKF